jgi:hypothetical protein
MAGLKVKTWLCRCIARASQLTRGKREPIVTPMDHLARASGEAVPLRLEPTWADASRLSGGTSGENSSAVASLRRG